MEGIIQRLKRLLRGSVIRNWGEGLLLSGGLDTAILAYLTHPKPRAITVAFKGREAPDAHYSSLIAQSLGLEHYIYFFDKHEVMETIKEVVRIMKSFDPMEIRNSVAIYIALKKAKENGLKRIMTGDGADELFAGYSFFFDMERGELEQELKKLWQGMRFSSVPLAQDLGLEAKLPYLDPQFMSYAMEVDVQFKVRQERGHTWGKWILRKAFEGLLPEEVIWRIKTPIEMGSGTSALAMEMTSFSDEEFEQAKDGVYKEDGVILQHKEQLPYYQVFRSLFGVIPRHTPGCPYCGSELRGAYCPTCGAYPIDQ